jgi:hypothetical protein
MNLSSRRSVDADTGEPRLLHAHEAADAHTGPQLTAEESGSLWDSLTIYKDEACMTATR